MFTIFPLLVVIFFSINLTIFYDRQGVPKWLEEVWEQLLLQFYFQEDMVPEQKLLSRKGSRPGHHKQQSRNGGFILYSRKLFFLWRSVNRMVKQLCITGNLCEKYLEIKYSKQATRVTIHCIVGRRRKNNAQNLKWKLNP